MDDLHVNNARWESDGVRVAGCSPHAVALMPCVEARPLQEITFPVAAGSVLAVMWHMLMEGPACQFTQRLSV